MMARGAYRVAAGLLLAGGLLVGIINCTQDPLTSTKEAPRVPALRIESETGQDFLGVPQGRVAYIDVDLVGPVLDIDGYSILIGFNDRYFEVVSVESGNWTEWRQLSGPPTLDYEVFSDDDHDHLGMIKVESSVPRKQGARSTSTTWVRVQDTVQTLCRIGLMVDDDRTIQCTWFPINFAWEGCDDNVLLRNHEPVPRRITTIYDYYGSCSRLPCNPYKGMPRRSNSNYLPVFYPVECPPQAYPQPGLGPSEIEILNGGIETLCWQDIWPGDLDNNYEFYQPNDLSLFTLGLLSEDRVTALAEALGGGRWPEYEAGGAISSTDVDNDGYPFTLWDYYLFVLNMQESPECYWENRQYVVDGEVRFGAHNGIVRVRALDSLGAVMLTFQGKAELQLLAPGCEMKYRYDGGKTRAVLRPYTTACAPHIPAGALVRFYGGAFIGGEAVLRALPPVAP